MKTITKIFAAMALALPFVNAEAEDYGFGDMGGVFNVSESGAATYTLPFDLPEGINGMQPSLGLVYNSQNGNGVAGMGVSIYGTSVITRTAKDIYHNGTAKGISYTDNDSYSLDGVRLIDIAQNDYRPENSPADYFTKTTNGFKAELQNGRTAYYEYKATANGVAYAWYLNRIEDKWGNVMYYSYSTFNGCVYLTRVQYGTNLGASTGLSNIVTFGYDTRNDVMPYIVNGTKCSMGRRLTSVTVKTNSVERNKYTLTYSNTDAFSRLTKVEESYGSTKLPPVTLGWSRIPTGISQTSFTISDNYNIVTLPNFTHVGFMSDDFNGDGLTDIISCFYPNNGSINNGYGEGRLFLNKGNNEYKFSGSYTLGLNCKDDPFTYESQNLIVDFMGDGNKEFVIPIINGKKQIQLHTSNAGLVGGNTLCSSEMPAYTVGCLYNNGKECFVLMDKGNNTEKNGYKTIITYRDDDGYIKTCGGWIPLSQSPDKLFIADYNADGMQDLLVMNKSGYTIFWNQGVAEGNMPFSNSKKTTGSNMKNVKVVQTGDFNGDGLADFVTNATDDCNWYFYLNNGNGSFTQKKAATMNNPVACSIYPFSEGKAKFVCNVFDFNHDGKDDIVISYAQYNIWISGWINNIYTSKQIKEEELSQELYNNSLNNPNVHISKFFNQTYTFWMTSDGSTLTKVKTASSNNEDDALNGYYMTGDFNGDGFIELVNYGYDCYNSTNANVSSTWHIYRNPSISANTNKVTYISNGPMNTDITISYSTLTNSAVYTKGSDLSYPLVNLQVPLNVVRQTYQQMAYNFYTTNYKYSGLRAHLQGRGLLGFTTVEASNTTTGEKRTTTVNSLHSTFYEPSKVTTTITKGDKTATTETTFKVITDSKNDIIHFTYPYTIKETGFYGEITTSIDTFDNKFRLLKQQTKYYKNANMYKQVEYSDYKKVGGVYKPQTVVTTQKHYDDANVFTTKTTYTYDTKGNPTKMVENAATVPVTHEYTYSGLGNMLTHKVSASGITAVTTTLTYDATNRFVASEKSSANSLITNYTYNNLGRLTKKQEGISGSLLTTSYTYDAIGNITQITYPDNTKTTYTRGWGKLYPDRAYYITATTTAQAPITTWYDNLGREVETTSTGEKGVSLTSTKSYNTATGQLYSHYNKIGGLTISETRGYNKLGQLTSVSSNSGKKITYSYSARSVTSTQSGINYILQKKFDAWGNTTHVSVNACTSTTYKYSSNGQPVSVRYADASYQDYMASTMTYDNRGLQTSLTDIDAGKTSYEYDALGRVTKQTDARGNITTNTYNASGLLTKQVCGGVVTTYTYDNKLRLTKESTGSQSIAYEYDDKNRLTKKSYSIDGTSLSYSYVYNSYGQMTAQTFPDGMTENYTYDSYGNLATIKIGGQRVWELNSYNGTQRTAYLGTAPLILTKNYSAKGLLTGTSVKKGSTSLHSFGYTFDGATGNLTQRTGMNGTETFKYDQFDRLNTGTSYALNGNIASKTGIGKYTYDTGKKNAVVQVENTGNLIQGAASLTYNAFNKVATVVQGTNTLTITYGPDRQRTKTVLVNGSNTTTTLYADNYEQRTVNGTTTTYHYVASPDGLAAVYVKSGSTATAYYIETDHLGSIIRAYDYIGNTKFSAAYDAWGNQTVSTNAIGLTRGYTGHEHWNQFGLIDMNGRFYDPLLGRFLSPDPYVQAPDNPQSYNRYAYCFNNPLKYTDPSGNISEFVAFMIFSTISNGLWQGVEASARDESFWSGFGKGAAIGAVSSVAGNYAGQLVSSAGFMGGFAGGFTGGFTGGFIAGYGNALINNSSDPLMQGIYGGLASGVIGGLAGGLNAGGYARDNGGNYWTGARKQDIVFKIDEHNLAKPVGGKDYDRKSYNGKHVTKIDGSNPNIEIGQDENGMYVYKIKIPKNVDGVTAIESTDGFGIKDCNLKLGISHTITITSYDKINTITLHGYRWTSTPVVGRIKLFHLFNKQTFKYYDNSISYNFFGVIPFTFNCSE